MNDVPETKNDLGTIIGGSTNWKPSTAQLVDYDSDSNSPRSTQPESHTRSTYQEVVELSSDDDVQKGKNTLKRWEKATSNTCREDQVRFRRF